MNPEVKAKWTKALRTGDYEQGTGQLRTGNRHCCLGVLAVEAGHTITESGHDIVGGERDGYLAAFGPLGLSAEHIGKLWKLNDGSHFDGEVIRKHSFAEIADYIEANL